MQSANKARVLLGEVGAAHGIRGEVMVRAYTADPADIAAYGNLEDRVGIQLPPLKVVRVTPKGVVCRFSGIADRTAAEKLRGTELWIVRDRLPPPAPGDYYYTDLIGLSAIDPAGTPIGKVVAVTNFGAGDLLEIAMTGGGTTEYVPFTNACVPDVNIAAHRITIVLPETVEAHEEAVSEAARSASDSDQSPG
ncbi:MAG: ribosome maturation factor RimM [Hyphomicrobiaceae bacterium]|nr:ribosome maturation factor RimM [Hyphomicrobiaceae bacterium]